MNASFTLHTFSEADILAHLDALSDVLSNCVNGGASVSFMLPLRRRPRTRSGGGRRQVLPWANVRCWWQKMTPSASWERSS